MRTRSAEWGHFSENNTRFGGVESRLTRTDKVSLNEDCRDSSKQRSLVQCLEETLVFGSCAESNKESLNTLKLCLK